MRESDVIVAPDPLELLTLAFVRDGHLRGANGNDEDELIDRLIRSAYGAAERATERALLPQTRRAVYPDFGGEHSEWSRHLRRRALILPTPPLLEVLAIEYVAASTGEVATIDASTYEVLAPIGPRASRGAILLKRGAAWPATEAGHPEAVRVTYRAGYEALDAGSSPPDDQGRPPGFPVPQEIIDGMLLVIGERYKTRSESIVGSVAWMRASSLWELYRDY